MTSPTGAIEKVRPEQHPVTDPALNAPQARQRPPGTGTGIGAGSSWGVPAALVVLSLFPVVAGSLRMAEVAGGPQMLPANPRIDAVPAPVVVHIVAAALFALLGAFQFSALLRRSRPQLAPPLRPHARRGRPGRRRLRALDDAVLHRSPGWRPAVDRPAPGRLGNGRKHRLGVHRDPPPRHRRAPRVDDPRLRLAVGAGTQAFTQGVGEAAFGTSELSTAASITAGWVSTAAVAEGAIRRPAVRRARRARTCKALE